MDNKEAIEILNITCGKQIFSTANEDDIEKLKQAFNIAITAIRDSQPDWSQAPEWAQWYAIDGDGQRWWFEIEPTFKGTTYNGKGKIEIDNSPERMKLFKRPGL